MNLSKKPLVEAILELRWSYGEAGEPFKRDPAYRFLIGKMQEKLSGQFPHYQELEASSIPDEMIEDVVQHRFRAKANGWPVYQLGPGVLTINETEGYTWEGFYNVVASVIDAFYKSYSSPSGDVKLRSIHLRYIDAVEFNFDRDNALVFLRKHLKLGIEIESPMSEVLGKNASPYHLDLRFNYPCDDPDGILELRFRRGRKPSGEEALIWETMVHSFSDRAPNDGAGVLGWMERAHTKTDSLFFAMIEGELLERFK